MAKSRRRVEAWRLRAHNQGMVGYQQDFVQWTREQADALRSAARAGANLPVDWENVAEEIESSGRSDRHEIESRIGTIIEHLLKLQSSPATMPRGGWRATVVRERATVMDRLADSPSLRPQVAAIVAHETRNARRVVALELEEFGERLAELPDYTEEQVLGDWLP